MKTIKLNNAIIQQKFAQSAQIPDIHSNNTQTLSRDGSIVATATEHYPLAASSEKSHC